MQKSSASKGGHIQLLDALVWLWLVMCFVFVVEWRSTIGTIIAVVSGMLLIGASLWVYRRAGGTWVRLIIGLGFLLGVIWLATR
jgi:hypothetical protein